VVREDYNGGGWAEHAYHPNGRQQRLRTCDGVTWAEATYDEEAGRVRRKRTWHRADTDAVMNKAGIKWD
jgi:hypothetical protein